MADAPDEARAKPRGASPSWHLVSTRAREAQPARESEASALELELAAAGVQVHAFALIRVVAPADPQAARRVLARLQEFALAVPVSPSAVQAALRLREPAWPTSCAVGLVGQASLEAFERGLRARGEDPGRLRLVCARQAGADSEALWRELQAWRKNWSGERVLVLRGDGGRDWLAATLREAGADVQVQEIYRRAAASADPASLQRLRELLALGAAWQIGAASALHNLCALLDAAGLDARRALADQRALVHHPRVAEAARQAGFGRVEQVEFRAAALLRALRAG